MAKPIPAPSTTTPAVHRPVPTPACDRMGEDRVVACFGVVGAAIVDRPTGVDQLGLDGLLQLETAVVGSDCDAAVCVGCIGRAVGG